MKKKIFFILLVMLLGFINILTIQNRYIANAATIGQILVVPESGWTRFDDGDKNIRYSEGFKFSLTNNGYYKGVRHEVKADISAQKIEFSFYGTKLRLFDYVYNNRTKNSKISFDGGPFEVCSAYSMTGAGPQALFYEKTGLDKKIHDVAIEIPKESAYFCLDSLDIDEDGYLIDKSKLQILYDTHKNNVQGSYTNLSWNIYKTVLDDTGIILGKTNVTPDEIDTEYNNLKVAISGLQIGPLTIGQTSTVPEDGWTRFDDNDTKIKYSDGFSTIFSKNLYKSNRHEVKADTNIYKIEFSFYGSKLRLYDYVYDNRTKNSRISFDRKPYEVCSAYSSNKSASQALFYEKTGLDKKIHDVVIEIPLEYAYFCLDFLDIDGYLIDKSELQGLYDAHKNDSQGNYADEGWNVFKESLDKAYTILVKIDSVQDEINVTVNDLKTAIKNLLYKQEVPVEKLEGIAPTKHDGSDGRITGTTSAMEYKLATSTDYTAVTGKEITDLKVGTYNIRYAAKLGFNAGAVVNVEVPDGAPDDPKLNADQGVPIEKLEGIAPTKHDGSDGRITGATSAMEYKLATSIDYTAVTGKEITDLKAGTYNIRYASKPGFNSGAVVNVEVPDGAPDDPKLNANQGVQTKIENESNKSNKRRNSYRKSKQLITGNGIAVQPTKNDIGLGLMLKSESMEILLTYSWRDKKLGGTVTNVLNSTHNYAGSIITAFESGRAKLSIEYSDYRNLKYIYKYEPITNSLIKVQDVLNIDGNNIELLVEKDATYYVTITPVAENMLLKEGWNTVNGFTYRIEGLNLKTGWIFENSAWYYVDEILKVRVENNWRLINNKWYAFNERGEMRTGWYYDRGAWYFLNKPNGDMGTGWRIVDGLWYYFRFNGSMASNTVIEGYKLGIDGAMINL